MKRVPRMENPLPEQIFAYGSRIPCFDVAKDIILAETAKNNKILSVSDISGHPSETVVVIDFTEGPQNEYAGLKSRQWNKKMYQYLGLGDNKGALEINFGRKLEI